MYHWLPEHDTKTPMAELLKYDARQEEAPNTNTIHTDFHKMLVLTRGVVTASR